MSESRQGAAKGGASSSEGESSNKEGPKKRRFWDRYDPFTSLVLTIPIFLIYHLGIDINKGLNAGDRERMAADPDWAMTYAGTIHLGLDPRKLFVAWERGATMAVDVYDPTWDFWEHVPRPLEELRAEYRIPPLDPADAALDDDQVRADPFRRPGEPDPPTPGSST